MQYLLWRNHYKISISVISIKGHNLLSYFLFSKKFRKCYVLLPAFYLIIWLMKLQKKFEKIAILKIGELVSFWAVKPYFGILPLKWCLFRHGKNLVSQILSCNTYCYHQMWSVLSLHGIWPFYGSMICSKDIFCFHEPIFISKLPLPPKHAYLV